MEGNLRRIAVADDQLLECGSLVTDYLRNSEMHLDAVHREPMVEFAYLGMVTDRYEPLTRESEFDLFVIADRKPNWRVCQEVGDLIDREVTTKSADKRQFMDGSKNNDPLVREAVSDHFALKGINDFCEIMWRYYAGQ